MKFATIDKTIAVKTLGKLESEDSGAIEKIIVEFFKT